MHPCAHEACLRDAMVERTRGVLGAKMKLFEPIGCNRKLPSDAHAQVHPMESRTSIGWMLTCPSDALPPFNPLRLRISIH